MLLHFVSDVVRDTDTGGSAVLTATATNSNSGDDELDPNRKTLLELRRLFKKSKRQGIRE